MRDAIISPKLKAQVEAFQAEPLKIGDKVLVKKSDAGGLGGNSKSKDELVTYDIVGILQHAITISVKTYGRT